MVHIKKGGQSELFCVYLHYVQNTILWKLQVPKVDFITLGQRGGKPSLSNQAVFAPFPLKVVWSGISLIAPMVVNIVGRAICQVIGHRFFLLILLLSWFKGGCGCLV